MKTHLISALLISIAIGLWWAGPSTSPSPTTTALSFVQTTKSSPAIRALPPTPTPPTIVPTQAFATWLQRYQLGDATTRQQLLPEGERLAQQRQAQLYHLIKDNPRAALEAAIPEPSRRFLPPSIARHLEQRINATGELAVLAATPQPGKAHLIKRPTWREARIGDHAFDAYVYGQRAKDDTQYNTSILGIAVKDRIAVLDQPSRIVSRSHLPLDAKLEPSIAFDDHPAPTATDLTTPIVTTSGKNYPVCCATHATALSAKIAASQRRSGMIVEALGGTPAPSAGPSPAPLSTTGPKNVLVIIADFSDATGAPTDQSSSTTINSAYVGNRLSADVSDYFSQVSYGKISIGSVSVTNLLRMPGSLASYATSGNTAKLKNDALAAAASSNPSSFDHVCVVFKTTAAIPGNQWDWTGLADLGGNFSWFNGWFSLSVVSHELSHNYGMRHANLWRVATSNPVDPNGFSEEYGDPFDVMGSGPESNLTQQNFPNPSHLNRTHWLADSAVQTISTSGTYRVHRYDHKNVNQTNTLALRFARNANQDYWIGYRRKYVGHPTHSDISNGAYIFWAYADNIATDVIDIDTPGTNDTDASLNVGSTFNDTAAGVSFQVMSAGGSGIDEYIDIAVNFQPRIVFAPPVLSVDEITGSITVQVQRRNNSTGTVTAHYASVAGTATAGVDYTSVSGDLTWANGDMTPREIVVPIATDAIDESPETFSLVLSGVTGAVLADGTTVTITIQEGGDADITFVPPFLTSGVRSLIVQPNQQIALTGYFSVDNIDGIARLNPNGPTDGSFNQGSGLNPTTSNLLPEGFTIARQPDGKLLVGGNFTAIRDFARNRIARLNADGTLDTTFNAGTGPNKPVNTILVLPDAKLLVAGAFTTWNGSARAGLVRLNEDGTLDATLANLDTSVDKIFSSGILVSALALQPIATAPHYRILVGGAFYRPFSNGGFHSGIVALNATDGLRDTTFDAPIGAHAAGNSNSLGPVSAIAVQPDGKVIVGGQFTGFGGVNAGHLARLTFSGTNDSAFISSMSGGLSGDDVTALLLQGDGKILVVGPFTNASGASPAQSLLARYTSTGSFDSQFRPSLTPYDNGTDGIFGAFTLAMQSEARLIIGLNGYGTNNEIRRIFTSLPQRPSVIGFSSPSATAIEGTNATLTVTRTGGTLGAVTVNYSTVQRTGTTATPGADYTTTTGTLTWAAGDNAPKAITVPIALDAFASEPTESFDVWLASPTGGTLLGDIQQSNVSILEADLGNTPHIAFGINSGTVTENAGTLSITVTANPAPTGTVTVPILYSGTATQGTGKDYLKGPDSLTFTAAETSKNFNVTILQDSLLEANETLTLTLGTPVGSAVIGSPAAITLTITDDEAAPAISPSGQPTSRLVAQGTSTTFEVTATGNPAPTYQWRKGTSNIGGATNSTYPLSNIQVSQGTSYNVIVKSALGTLTSSSANLGVLDTTAKTINGVANGNITLTVNCSSNITGFQWFKNGVLVSDIPGHISGFNKKSLTISKLVNASGGPPPVPGDAGIYTCQVTLPGVALPMPSGNFTLNVLDLPPDITDSFTLPDAIVGGAYSKQLTWDLAQNRTPTSFSASNLPPGITINTTTGLISGKPNLALTTAFKDYTVTLKATNAKSSDTRTTNLRLFALPPNTTGSYVGYFERSTTLTNNGNLGGRIDLTVNTNATFTAKVINGTSSHSFNSTLSTSVGNLFPTGHLSITRAPLPNLVLDFTIDTANNRLSLLTLSDTAGSTTGTAWRNVTPASNQLDLHTLGLELAVPNSALPQGTGYASFTVATTGKLTVTGKLADGVAITTVGHISSTGEVLIYQASATTDTILGKITVAPGADNTNFTDYSLSGLLSWSRKQQASNIYTYRDTFGPINLSSFGSRYRKPLATETPMALAYTAGVTTKNAEVTFTNADFGTPAVPPNADLLIKPGGSTTVIADSNPDRTTTFSITPSSGFFKGTITLKDVNPLTSAKITRNANFEGLIIRRGSSLTGQGFVLVPNIPALVGEVLGKTKSLSANVSLESSP